MIAEEEKYHRTMHRLYRAVRGRVAQRLSPLTPEFAEALREVMAREVALQGLRPPRGAR